MLMPPVSRYMTPSPRTIPKTASLAEAHRLMLEHHVRHLPVIDGGALCGIVSDRELRVLESAGRIDPDTTTVAETMTERPFVVTGDTALDEVVEIMGEHKYGSVVIEGHEGVEGIFTAVDACRVLAELLRRATA
jgi:acetoin utilization protein AcuB